MDSQTELAALDRAMRSYYAGVSQGDAAAVARHFTVPAMLTMYREMGMGFWLEQGEAEMRVTT
jgi:hypothetical protein